jgi:acyl-CoA thioester hydrolase
MSETDFRFWHPFRVRYSEIDAQGIVFNAHYLTYFDTAITEYFRVIGCDYKALVTEGGSDFHTVKSLVEYKAPLAFDEEIEVGVRTGRIGNSSLTFALAIRGRGETAVRATGEIVWVNTDQATHTATALPDALKAAITAFETVQR